MRTLWLLGWLTLATCQSANNGYVASYSTRAQLAGTRVAYLDTNNGEIARLANGFTISIWLRFPDLSNVMMPSIQIILDTDGA